MSERVLATRLIALRVLKDMIAKADEQVREQLSALMLPGDRTTAAVFVQGLEGVPGSEAVPVGHVLRTKGTTGTVTAAVTDVDALVQWCQQHVPTEVQTLTVVRPSFQKRLIDDVKAHGGWVDTASGELLEVDGITVTPPTPGKPILQVKPSEGAEEVVRAAWNDGRLTVEDVIALPASAQ